MEQAQKKRQSKIRLLVLSHSTLPFVKQDEMILRNHFDVKVCTLNSYNTIPAALWTYGKVLLWLLTNIRKCDGLYLVFADVYGFFLSVFSRLFNKKLFVRVGGFDAAWLPQLKYGTYHNRRSRFFSWFTFKTACKILPVCQSLVYDPGSDWGPNIPEQGITHFYPDVDPKKIIVIANGYTGATFTPNEQIERMNRVLMIGNIKNHQTFKIKGVDIFIKLAEATPKIPFTLVGADSQLLRHWITLPQNLTILPYVPHKDLPSIYQSASVFMCPSLTEGMPNVLAEAMLCECVPMGFRIGSIPEIIGDTGVVLDSLETSQIQEGLFRALAMDGKSARIKIMTQYPLEAREKKLVQTIESEFTT
jgi:glycosyltransferase involved in cell wall biosynthesis